MTKIANVNSLTAVELEKWAKKNGCLFTSKYHWVRCSCHIINIAVKCI